MQHSLDSSTRIKFIDGLRAIAVIMVMLFHFYYQQLAGAGDVAVTPIIFQQLVQFGNMGVYIFFVISGFIVSYVTYDRVRSWKFIASFIVKRQVRLDPPFWLAILVGITLAAISVHLLGNPVYMPSFSDVLVNAFYLFDFYGRYDIIRVGWTLCLEIQFYLMFITLIYLLTRFCSAISLRTGIHLLFFLFSLWTYYFFSASWDAFILKYWFIFFYGVSITLRIKGELDQRIFFLILITPFCLIGTDASMTPIYFSAGTAFLIYLSFKLKRSNVWLSSRFFQFYGLISYSLYLTHCLVGNKLIRVLKSILDWNPEGTLLTGLILGISFIISTIFAYFFYLFIERRSIRWSKRISALIT